MKRLKQLVAFLVSFALCTSAFPACNGNTIKLLFVFTGQGTSYLTSGLGMTQSQFATQMRDRLRTTINNSVGSNVAFVDVAGVMDYPKNPGFTQLQSYRDGTGLLSGPNAVGAVEYASHSYDVLKTRDQLGATHVVVVGRYTEDGRDGWALPQRGCVANGTPSPGEAFMGIDPQKTGNTNPYPNAISKYFIELMCGSADAGYASYYNLADPLNCIVAWTMEMKYGAQPNGPRPNGNQGTRPVAGTCWQVNGQGSTCYSDPHASIAAICPTLNPTTQPCTYANGAYAPGGASFTETLQKQFWGYANYTTIANGQTTYQQSYSCPGDAAHYGEQNRYSSYSSANFNGAPVGDANHDNVAKLNANFGNSTCFGGTPIKGQAGAVPIIAGGN